jgi:hypothetical protein
LARARTTLVPRRVEVCDTARRGGRRDQHQRVGGEPDGRLDVGAAGQRGRVRHGDDVVRRSVGELREERGGRRVDDVDAHAGAPLVDRRGVGDGAPQAGGDRDVQVGVSPAAAPARSGSQQRRTHAEQRDHSGTHVSQATARAAPRRRARTLSAGTTRRADA